MHKILILFCILLFVTPAMAMAKDKNKEHSPGESQHAQSLPWESDQYRQPSIQDIIDSYYWEQFQSKKYKKNGKKKKNLPPGLQKKLARGGELPPGWQKKVARGEVLDWRLYSRSVKLPQDLLRRLPDISQGTELMRLENRIFRILNDTREILDIFTINH